MPSPQQWRIGLAMTDSAPVLSPMSAWPRVIVPALLVLAMAIATIGMIPADVLAAPSPTGASDKPDDVYEGREVLALAATFPAGIRLELGRFRYKRFHIWGLTVPNLQVSLLHGYGTQRFDSDESIWTLLGNGRAIRDFEVHFSYGGGLGGIGQFRRFGADGSHEIGYMVWPLSGGLSGATESLGNTQIYYRKHFSGFFLETGLSFALWWAAEIETEDTSDEYAYPTQNPPLSAYLSLGTSSGRVPVASTRPTEPREAQERSAPGWTTTDIIQAALMLPAVARIDLVRWRWEQFQMGLLHGLFGLSWNLRGQFGVGLAGLGSHWRANGDGSAEYGFMVWPLLASVTDDLVVSYLNSQIYYRWNHGSHFVESGLWVSPIWLGDGKGGSVDFYPMNNPGISAYIGIGL